jgi:hypothetical protein
MSEAQHGGRRVGAGKPPYQPSARDRKLVEEMAGYGFPHEHICQLLSPPISKVTLLKYFKAELTAGLPKANSRVAKWLFASARKGDVAARIFLAKVRLRWKESSAIEHTGPNGGPIQSVTMTRKEFEETARKVAQEV